ncbi:MAG: hypothetical protein ACXAES_14260 [Promethearchaeota archaeon]|jgi:hypothetical protein
MKKEKKVIIRDKRLKKIRNNLREIIIRSVYKQIELLNKSVSYYAPPLDLSLEEQKRVYFLEGTKHKLYRTLRKSICLCPLCTQTDRDMVYIPDHDTWYCIECQEKDLIWDLSKGSEEDRRQHNYINWYLEQKEKFKKRYLNRDKAGLSD